MKWTSTELEMVRQHYAGEQNLLELSKTLGRTVASIKCKACSLGVVASKAIDEKDREYIRSLGGIMSVSDVSRKMGRAWNTVKKLMREEGVSYTPENTVWNPTDEEKALMNSRMTLKQLSDKIGRAEATILKKIRQLNLNPRIRVKKEVVPRPPRIKKEPKQAPIIRRDNAGIDRIRLAMERINRI